MHAIQFAASVITGETVPRRRWPPSSLFGDVVG